MKVLRDRHLGIVNNRIQTQVAKRNINKDASARVFTNPYLSVIFGITRPTRIETLFLPFAHSLV